LAEEDAGLLAKCRTYLQSPKNKGYDLNIKSLLLVYGVDQEHQDWIGSKFPAQPGVDEMSGVAGSRKPPLRSHPGFLGFSFLNLLSFFSIILIFSEYRGPKL
jgi:hypothetical protein